jgi:hypothetical protein
MAKGRQKAEWERTALLAAIGANPHRNVRKHKRPFLPNDFNPFADRRRKPKETKIKISVDCLKALCRESEQLHKNTKETTDKHR